MLLLVHFVLQQHNATDWVIYKTKRFVLACGSEGWEVQEHGANIDLASGKGILLIHNTVKGQQESQKQRKPGKAKEAELLFVSTRFCDN